MKFARALRRTAATRCCADDLPALPDEVEKRESAERTLEVDGETVTLNINYAAGHASSNNAFRMAFACGAPNEDTMGGATAVLTAADNGCTGTAGGQVATYNDNGVDGGIPAPNAIVAGGYRGWA